MKKKNNDRIKNSTLAYMGIIGLVLFLINYLSVNSVEGVLYYLSLTLFYTGVIWGWNRLIKSDK